MATRHMNGMTAQSCEPEEKQKHLGVAHEMGHPEVCYMSGDVLVSHMVSHAVPSALRGLTSGFGMEPGVSLSPWSPKLY